LLQTARQFETFLTENKTKGEFYMRNKSVTYVVQAAVIAALYVVLTLLANALGLSSYSIQVRFSEALCILPFFTPAAIPGLWIGCLTANLMTGAIIWDIVFGSIATLIGAVGTYLLRKHKFACTLPPVIANMVIVPWVLRYGYGFKTVYNGVDWSIPFNVVTVGIGEIISVCILGSLLLKVLNKYRNVIFRGNE
jgi:uncharacterized membrane protein